MVLNKPEMKAALEFRTDGLFQRFDFFMNRRPAVPSRSNPKPPGRVKVWSRYAISGTLRLGTAARRRFRSSPRANFLLEEFSPHPMGRGKG